MLSQRLESCLGLLPGQGRRILPFLGLGITLMATSVIAYATSTSLFLARIGSESLPILYILIGLCSIPVSAGFWQQIDHLPRLLLFRRVLWVALILVLCLRALVILDWPIAYYVGYISFNLLELLLNILLWTLISDYFTSLELKHHAILLSMSMTLGSFMGGICVRYLTDLLSTENLLLVMPLLYGISMKHLQTIGHTHEALETDSTPEAPESFWTSLQTFPRLLDRYPIVPFLAVQMVLSVFVWQLSEYQFLSVYSATFPEQNTLTEFFGLLSATMSVAELGITYFITRPLIQQWGVSRMNLLYPVTSLVSFVGLAIDFRLSAAVLANFNYDALYNSVAQPVQNLNYNAIPHRFAGRARVILDGLIYPASQALVGWVLLHQKSLLTPQELTYLGIGVSLLFLVVGYLTGKSYLRSLLGLLRSGSVSFGDVDEGLVRLPALYAQEVVILLQSRHPDAQLLGLDLAARLADPSQFLNEVQVLLPEADSVVRQSIVRFLSTCKHPKLNRYLRINLTSDNPVVREAVLEALITSHQPISKIQLLFFLEDTDPEVQALAYVVSQLLKRRDTEIEEVCQQARSCLQDPAAQQAIVRVISTLQDRQLIPLLTQVIGQADATTKREGLMALVRLAKPGDRELVQLGLQELHHPNPHVRVAGLQLLQVLRDDHVVASVVQALADPEPEVRWQASQTITTYGDRHLSLVEPFLWSERVEVIQAAIAAIGQMQTPAAEDLLFDYLQADYAQATRTLIWKQQIPMGIARWQVLSTALEDYHEQILQRVFSVIAALRLDPQLGDLRDLLNSTDAHIRANAVETLLSLKHRRFVQPLLPLLEALASRTTPEASEPYSEAAIEQFLLDILKNATHSSTKHTHLWHPQLTRLEFLRSRWIRIGALLALPQNCLPKWLIQDADPIVQAVTLHLMNKTQNPSHSGSFFVNRIFFLKQVSLLQSLSLDDILLVDKMLKQQEFLAGELIFQEGSIGEDFYIIYRGTILILKRVKQSNRELTRLGPGEYFGDMALFDHSPRSATAVAHTDCTLLTLERTHFQNLIAQRPEIVLQMCRVLSMRLRETNEQLQ